MPKQISIYLDGTAERRIKHQISNVGHLRAVTSDDQVHHYEPGVGTPQMYSGGLIVREIKRLLGLVFGLGLQKNVKDAYRFLIENYEPGDQVFLFGFSRGAYTARILAGLIHKVGLLHQPDPTLIRRALRLHRKRSGSEPEDFKTKNAQEVTIHFMGLFDTVSSVGWIWDPRHYPYTSSLPGVKSISHAISIDERRAFFRQNQIHVDRADESNEVWFPGVHGDVGGHYRHSFSHSDSTKTTLAWIIGQASAAGWRFDREKALKLINGRDPVAKLHRSLKGFWWIAEFIPKWVSVPKGEWSMIPRDQNGWGGRYRLNLGKRRTIKPNDRIHESVLVRWRGDDHYRPSNLPSESGQIADSLSVEPMKPLDSVI